MKWRAMWTWLGWHWLSGYVWLVALATILVPVGMVSCEAFKASKPIQEVRGATESAEVPISIHVYRVHDASQHVTCWFLYAGDAISCVPDEVKP